MPHKLGRKPRKFNRKIPHYTALRFGSEKKFMHSIAPIPDKVDNTLKITGTPGMMANDTLGDCTCAAFYHALQIWTSMANVEDTESDDNVIALYEQACGYNPADSSTDQGGCMQDVLAFLMKTGAPVGIGLRNKIQAFVEVDTFNMEDIRRTIYDCGAAYVGVNLPQSAMDAPIGGTWDVGGDETILGGHAIALVGYDAIAHTFKLISWGQYYTATEAFMQKYADEVYGIADPAFIAATGKTPLGMTEDDLDAAMQEFKEASGHGFF